MAVVVDRKQDNAVSIKKALWLNILTFGLPQHEICIFVSNHLSLIGKQKPATLKLQKYYNITDQKCQHISKYRQNTLKKCFQFIKRHIFINVTRVFKQNASVCMSDNQNSNIRYEVELNKYMHQKM